MHFELVSDVVHLRFAVLFPNGEVPLLVSVSSRRFSHYFSKFIIWCVPVAQSCVPDFMSLSCNTDM